MNYRVLHAQNPFHQNIGGRLFERVNGHARMLSDRPTWQASLAQRWEMDRLHAAAHTSAVELRLLHERMDALDALLEQTVLTRRSTP